MSLNYVEWRDEEVRPRIDKLTAPFKLEDETLWVAHPEYFREGDLVRLGTHNPYMAGYRYEHGVEIEQWYERNEAVRVMTTGRSLVIERQYGATYRWPLEKGEPVTIIGNLG